MYLSKMPNLSLSVVTLFHTPSLPSFWKSWTYKFVEEQQLSKDSDCFSATIIPWNITPFSRIVLQTLPSYALLAFICLLYSFRLLLLIMQLDVTYIIECIYPGRYRWSVTLYLLERPPGEVIGYTFVSYLVETKLVLDLQNQTLLRRIDVIM